MHTTREVCSENTSRFLWTSRATISTTVERYLYFSHCSRHSPQTVNQDLFPHGATAQPIAQWPFFLALATCFATCSLWWEPRQRSPPQRRPRWSRVPDVWRSNEVRAAAIGTDDVRRQFDRRLRSPCTTQTSTVPMALGVHFVHTSGHRAPVLGALATCFATCSLWWEPRQRSPPQRRPWPSTMWRKEPDR